MALLMIVIVGMFLGFDVPEITENQQSIEPATQTIHVPERTRYGRLIGV